MCTCCGWTKVKSTPCRLCSRKHFCGEKMEWQRRSECRGEGWRYLLRISNLHLDFPIVLQTDGGREQTPQNPTTSVQVTSLNDGWDEHDCQESCDSHWLYLSVPLTQTSFLCASLEKWQLQSHSKPLYAASCVSWEECLEQALPWAAGCLCIPVRNARIPFTTSTLCVSGSACLAWFSLMNLIWNMKIKDRFEVFGLFNCLTCEFWSPRAVSEPSSGCVGL